LTVTFIPIATAPMSRVVTAIAATDAIDVRPFLDMLAVSFRGGNRYFHM
jgi:hypothetical protein